MSLVGFGAKPQAGYGTAAPCSPKETQSQSRPRSGLRLRRMRSTELESAATKSISGDGRAASSQEEGFRAVPLLYTFPPRPATDRAQKKGQTSDVWQNGRKRVSRLKREREPGKKREHGCKGENKLMQTDEISRKSRLEIDETFLFRRNDTPGKVVMLCRNDTPGSVAIRLEKSGCRTSFKKTDSPLIFEGEVKKGAARGNRKKIEKNFKKGIAFF